MKLHEFTDGETTRRQRNLTSNQKKNNIYTQEGVIVNSYCKNECNFNEICDSLIISSNANPPQELTQDKITKEKSLLPISGIALGVMGAITGLTYFIKQNTKSLAKTDKQKVLPTLTRHVALNEETHQALYRMVRNPNRQTILAGSGVIALTATAFMGKTFFDGVKEVWVKKKEADIQKNLQENLIAVETQTFSGKMQIIRNMLSEKTSEFENAFNSKKDIHFKSKENRLPRSHSSLAMTENNKHNTTLEQYNSTFITLGIATSLGIVGLGFLAMKNLTKGKKYLEESSKALKNTVPEIIKNSTEETMKEDKEILKNIFTALGTPKKYIKEQLQNLNWEKADIKIFEEELMSSTAKVEKALGGDGTDKPTYYSHVDDYRAHLYNYLLDTDNKQFKQLFFGIAGLSALGYAGKLAGEAIKEVEVKKINAQTELDLQKRLVSTELRNFKAKKDSAINPLMEEFYRQKSLGKSDAELKTIADNILYEIKNGAPFVYS